MDTVTTLIIIFLAIGAMQGLFFGFVLLREPSDNKISNRFLAILLLLLSYRLLLQILRLFGLGYYDGWYYIMLDLSWCHGALLFYYVKTQLQPNYEFSLKDTLHAVPLIVQVIFSIFVRLQNIYWDGTRESLTWLGYWGYWLWMNQPTIYIVASALIIAYSWQSEKYLRNYEKQHSLQPEHSDWLRKIIAGFKLYFIIVMIIFIADRLIFSIATDDSYFYFKRDHYYPFFLGISILTYWLGIEGYKRKDLPLISKKITLDPYKKEQLEHIAIQLENSMHKEKLYKQPDLTLNKLAQKIGVKPYLISQCLNEILMTKFNSYINNYRISEVKSLLKDPNKSKHNLLTLALEAGFNSKSSFNRAVRKQLGISPIELRKQQ